MSVSASGIAITPKESPSAIGVPECLSGWWRMVEAAAEANGFHQGNSGCRLLLTLGSIKFQKYGGILRCDLGEPMALVMAIGNKVFGECF